MLEGKSYIVRELSSSPPIACLVSYFRPLRQVPLSRDAILGQLRYRVIKTPTHLLTCRKPLSSPNDLILMRIHSGTLCQGTWIRHMDPVSADSSFGSGPSTSSPRPSPPPSTSLIGGAQMLSLPGGITCHTTTKEYECHNDRVSFFSSLQAVCA